MRSTTPDNDATLRVCGAADRLRQSHTIAAQDVIQALHTDGDMGLEPSEASSRLARFGPNRIPSPAPTPFVMRLLSKLREPMSLLLTGASAVAGLGLGERLDAVVILAIVVANAAIALAQEGKAARSLEALRTLETPEARVVREGRAALLAADDLVVGDIVLLAAGDRVPADIRMIETASVEVDESLLTGESLPVPKDASVVSDADAALGDRLAMGFSGTMVSRGTGRGVVVATGPATELGVIAQRLREQQPPTPLQVELAHLTGRLGLAAVLIALVVFALTLASVGLTTKGLERSLLSAVALAVAAVPEGLASVVTVALALGVRRMATAGAIVRLLPAVETLGSTDVILTDKTGTLTENRMRAEAVALPWQAPASVSDFPSAELRPVLEIAALCNDATLDPPTGDPLEVALLELAGAGLVNELSARMPRLGEAPFDSERKRMSTLHRSEAQWILFVKGAPEAVIERCREGMTATGFAIGLENALQDRLYEQAYAMAEMGMRVLSLARRVLDDPPLDVESVENDLTFVGLVGLRDPVRPEAAVAVNEAQEAGIRLIMVTGDHPRTAATIAEEVGIWHAGDGLVTGSDLRAAGTPSDPAQACVYARVDPDHKLALVEQLRSAGRVVAVTGDGLNDAPALRRADIGVAMGRSGSDAAREAADMVITDDNLSTIITAVREGRGIYDNIRKVVDYLVAANLSEIAVVVSCLLLFPGLGVPLLPIQLLWINLLTDGLPAIALGVDQIDPAVMSRPPRPRSERLLSRNQIERLLGRGLVIAAAAITSLVVVRYGWNQPWPHARAEMFSVLAVSQLFYAFAVHLSNGTGPALTRRSIFANWWLLAGVGAGLVLQIAVVTVAPAHEVFGTSYLSSREWALVGLVSAIPAFAISVFHGARFRSRAPRQPALR